MVETGESAAGITGKSLKEEPAINLQRTLGDLLWDSSLLAVEPARPVQQTKRVKH